MSLTLSFLPGSILGTVTACALIFAGCNGASPPSPSVVPSAPLTASPSTDPSAEPSTGPSTTLPPQSSADPSASPTGGSGFALRTWITQALPPVATFRFTPPLTIVNGIAITPGVIDLIYPGPLLLPLEARPIGAHQQQAIVEAARRAGLLEGRSDFTNGGIPPGGQTAHILFELDGAQRELIGDPNQQIECPGGGACAPNPGTPQAFGSFWTALTDLPTLVGGALGASRPYAPERLAVLVSSAAAADPTLPQPPARWPLADAFDAFGKPFPGAPDGRCGIVEGQELVGVLAAVRNANDLTRWTDSAGAERGLAVRILAPGEADPCPGR